MKILFIIPPFTQINTPYPAPMQLSGYLNAKGYQSASVDLSLGVALRIFSAEGLKGVFDILRTRHGSDAEAARTLALSEKYISIIGSAIRFLQGKDSNLAYTLAREGVIPQGEAFMNAADEERAFGAMGIQDKAKYYCSLMLDDLSSMINKYVSSHFALSRYAEQLARSAPEFDRILAELKNERNIIEKYIEEETDIIVRQHSPEFIGYTIPFPGNLLGAMISAKYVKEKFPNVKIVFGGGYVNTELRQLKDPRIFEFADFITLDDGELPIENIIKNSSCPEKARWVRTFILSDGAVEYLNDTDSEHLPHTNLPAPDMRGIDPSDYLAISEMLNPMHRLWSDGYWNKITLAHGCYWGKCTFCDVSLDYIGRYSPAKAARIVDWMEELMHQTGRSSFHFTDEAAPPALLREVALEILRRKLIVNWWGNIRFEKTYTHDLCRLLAASGCIAVSGGLEAAEDRLLGLINKGVTISQAARVLNNFSECGIFVHAYLIYGFPSQTEQELIDALEIVRQMFSSGLLQSAYWHRFSLTMHSPIFTQPDKYGIRITSDTGNPFANNDLKYQDESGVDYEKYAPGLRKALYNFMHGVGVDWPVNKWFLFPVPNASVLPGTVRKSLAMKDKRDISKAAYLWIGGRSVALNKGRKTSYTLHSNSSIGQWVLETDIAFWLDEMLQKSAPDGQAPVDALEWEKSFPMGAAAFQKFCSSGPFKEIRELGLLLL